MQNNRPNTNKSDIIHTYKYIQSMCAKLRLVEKMKRGRKERERE
jgi:hypothetical protein